MDLPRKHFKSDKKATDRRPVAFVILPILALALASISGCTGLTQANSLTAKSPSGSNGSSAGTHSSLSASEASLNFSNVNLGTRKTLPVVFTNTGSSQVTISNVTISGAGYTAGGVQSGQILASGEAATLNVTFDPAATGTLAGRITLASDAANSPANIALTGAGLQPPASHSASLNWVASTSTVTGYNVYRSTVSGGPYSKLSADAQTDSTDTTVTAGQTYYYVVTSVESSGLESAYSNEVTAIVP